MIANLLVHPVPRKWFMTDAEVTARQGGPMTAAAAPASAGGGFSPALLLAWAAVGIPILCGVWITLDKVAVLFR